jgi:hypothetical protein
MGKPLVLGDGMLALLNAHRSRILLEPTSLVSAVP